MLRFAKPILCFAAILSVSCEDNITDSESLPEQIFPDGKVQSFGDFYLYQTISGELSNVALAIIGNSKDSISLDDTINIFELPHPHIEVSISRYDIPVDNGYFESDIVPVRQPLLTNTWNAKSGAISIKLYDKDDFNGFDHFNLDLELKDIIFEDSNGNIKTIPRHIIEDAMLGWLPG
jgi:hypothetical protein